MQLQHSFNSDLVKPALRTALQAVWSNYIRRCSSQGKVISHLAQRGHLQQTVYHDHFAFRTFGAQGLGIDSIGAALTAHGYQQREYLKFPAKKLLATWFAPPLDLYEQLPRVFVSELQVEQLSAATKAVIGRYTAGLAGSSTEQAWAWVQGAQRPWQQPSWDDYQHLLQESEYAAWVLAHGYLLNHTALAVHRLHNLQEASCIEHLAQLLQEHQQGLLLNQEGGVIKASPDGGLLQFSTLADNVQCSFAGGKQRSIAGPYLEFAERKARPEFAGVAAGQLQEWQRRDGFEVGNADKIFQSTSLLAIDGL